jgi:D-alanyl-lipoteichoic acid acyltransferase DltB (MBOAT superfamily)
MIFNSVAFIPFFLVVYAAYLAARTRTRQNVVLLAASYCFYGYAAPRYVLLLAFYTLVSFAAAIAIERARSGWARRAILTGSVAINLGVLVYFKYAHFVIAQIGEAYRAFGRSSPLPSIDVLLPIGVSFFTFQCVAYIVDVYRGELTATRNLLEFAVFKSFFPQLVAGPIERGRHMLPQLAKARRVSRADVRDGLYFILLGYVLKCAIADRVAGFVDYQFLPIDSVDRTPEMMLLAIFAFGIQIYGDFAGYTYIALGLARLMGLELFRNFKAPYLATDIQDFWRRWHVTLSEWLRDYLYKPLGGSRASVPRTCLNLLITMGLGGLWHGASWTFIVWGLYHGAGLVLHRLTRPLRERLPMAARLYGGWLLTLAFVMFGWAIFRVQTVSELASIVSVLSRVQLTALLSLDETRVIGATLLVLLLVQYLEESRDGASLVSRAHPAARAALYSMGAATVLAVGFSSYRFIYFQF